MEFITKMNFVTVNFNLVIICVAGVMVEVILEVMAMVHPPVEAKVTAKVMIMVVQDPIALVKAVATLVLDFMELVVLVAVL